MGVVHAEQARLIGAAAVVPDRQRVPVGQLGSIAVDERARVGAGGPDLQVDAVKVDPAALPFAVGRLGPGGGFASRTRQARVPLVCLASVIQATVPDEALNATSSPSWVVTPSRVAT